MLLPFIRRSPERTIKEARRVIVLYPGLPKVCTKYPNRFFVGVHGKYNSGGHPGSSSSLCNPERKAATAAKDVGQLDRHSPVGILIPWPLRSTEKFGIRIARTAFREALMRLGR